MSQELRGRDGRPTRTDHHNRRMHRVPPDDGRDYPTTMTTTSLSISTPWTMTTRSFQTVEYATRFGSKPNEVSRSQWCALHRLH